MIELKRDDGMSVFLSFDSEGLELLIQSLGAAMSGTANSLEVVFDRSVITMKRSSRTETMEMVVIGGEMTTFRFHENKLVMSIEGEDLECLSELLSKCQETGSLGTSELIRVQVPKNKKLDYLYGTFLAPERTPSADQ